MDNLYLLFVHIYIYGYLEYFERFYSIIDLKQ